MLVRLTPFECGMPHRLRRPDPNAGRQRNVAYLALNPNGAAPTLPEGLTEWV